MGDPSDLVSEVVDIERYPLHQCGGVRYRQAVDTVRAALREDGCAIVPGFLRATILERLQRQAHAVLDRAHVNEIRSNPYSTRADPARGPRHPVNVFMERTNAFVPKAALPPGDIVCRLYHWPVFQRFVADCLEQPVIHEYADPYAALVLNLLRPGAQHPWHYDTNEFIVSTLVQPGDEGGVFEYCPGIRAPGNENYDRVAAVLADEDRREVRQVHLRAGDLQLFRGRFSLHRVTRVRGQHSRITAIFAYANQPGMVGRVERTRQLFGRVAEEHLAAEQLAGPGRLDGLTD